MPIRMPIKQIDKEVVRLCLVLNTIDGIETVESCCGHGKKAFNIFFKVNKWKGLSKLSAIISQCHIRHEWPNWKIENFCCEDGRSWVLTAMPGADGNALAKVINDSLNKPA